MDVDKKLIMMRLPTRTVDRFKAVMQLAKKQGIFATVAQEILLDHLCSLPAAKITEILKAGGMKR